MAKPQRAAEAFRLDWWFTKKEKTLEALSVSVGPLPSRTGPETSMSTKNTTPATAAHRTHPVSVIVPSRSRGLLAYGVEPPCIACMFFIMAASAVRSSSLGLNHKISVPGSFFTGTWPGGM